MFCQGSHLVIAMSLLIFEKLCVQNVSVKNETQAGVFKFLEFEERFRDGLERTVSPTIEK